MNAFRLALTSVCTMLVLTPVASATVLTFDLATPPANNATLNSVASDYGHQASGNDVPVIGYSYGQGNGFTPNIGVAYNSGTDFYDHAAFGGKVVYDSTVGTAGPLEITFTPNPGYAVKLNSFDTIGWGGTSYPTVNLEIRDATTDATLWSSSTTGTATFSPNFSGIQDQALKLRFFDVSDANSIALDNVNFDELSFAEQAIAVPEPMSGTLLGFGAASMLMWRRRASQRSR